MKTGILEIKNHTEKQINYIIAIIIKIKYQINIMATY